MINKKGTALMQVLLVTIVVATIAVAILRIAISRTTTAAATVRAVSAKNILEGCNAEIQSQIVRAISANPSSPVQPCDLVNQIGHCDIVAGGPTDIIRVNASCTPVTGQPYGRITYEIDQEGLKKL